jgi:hypothetical protein
MSSDYRKNNIEQDGDNEKIFASWMEDDDDDDNVLVGSEKGGGLKCLDDALLADTLMDAALHAEEERKPSSSPPDFYNVSDDNDRGWFDAQEGPFVFTSPSIPTQTQQPSSLAQHMKEQQFQSYGSEKSMEDPLDYHGTSSDSNCMDGSRESFGISMLEQDFQPPRKEPEQKKTITFANIIATPFGAQHVFLVSKFPSQTLDIFPDESSDEPPSSKSTLGDSSSDLGDFDDDSVSYAIDEDEDDKKIRRQLLYAFGGVGLFALLGFAGKKLLKLFDRTVEDTQDVNGGMDMTNVADQAAAVVGDGGSTYTSSAAVATENNIAFQASANASQSQMSMTGGFGMNPSGGAGQVASGNTMSAAHSQVMQSMAVNAASNAASSAATAASGFASAASAAAAVAAGTAVTTTVATVATVTTIAAAVRSSIYDDKFGALFLGSLAHLSVPFVTM